MQSKEFFWIANLTAVLEKKAPDEAAQSAERASLRRQSRRQGGGLHVQLQRKPFPSGRRRKDVQMLR